MASSNLSAPNNKSSNMLAIPLNTFSASDDEENKTGPGREMFKPTNEIQEEFESFKGTDDDNESFYDAVSSGEDEYPEISAESNYYYCFNELNRHVSHHQKKFDRHLTHLLMSLFVE